MGQKGGFWHISIKFFSGKNKLQWQNKYYIESWVFGALAHGCMKNEKSQSGIDFSCQSWAKTGVWKIGGTDYNSTRDANPIR